jgi:hypothetical protein
MRCPCATAGNPRDHGVMCHYAGISDTPCTQALGKSGLATTIIHDRRLCVTVCKAHARWRGTTSTMSGAFAHVSGVPIVSHHCHARLCTTSVRPELLMCARHWHLVPPRIQRAVYAAYRPGQCDDKKPSKAWHEAADAAIGYVALHEGHALVRAEIRALVAHGHREQVIDVTAMRLCAPREVVEETLKILLDEGS